MKYDVESIKNRKVKVNKIRNILFIFMIIVLYNIVLSCVSYISEINTPSIFGYKAYFITTNSMKPAISDGDVIIVKQIKENNLEEGDIISFFKDGQVITHRIVELKEIDNERQYITKGDNNNLEDTNTVKFEQVEGKLVIKIPFLGNILMFLKNEILVLIIILIILLLYFYKISLNERKEERRRKKEIEDKKYEEKE